MPSEITLDIPVMLLAAGRGERMRPLTDRTPKPLLTVRGKPLLQWRMEALLQAGFHNGVINTAWLGEQIEARFGNTFAHPPATGSMQLRYSREGLDFGGALETAGGICRSLPLLGDAFWAMAADVFAPDFVFSRDDVQAFLRSDKLAHIWLVPNPEHNPAGDFGLDPASGLALNIPKDTGMPRYTFSTIGLYRKELFLQPWCDVPPGNPAGTHAALAPLLRLAMDQQRVSAALYTGAWTDVGTPQRLALLNN
ncbi:nucleotidyltransferase family protein [Rhodoferax sp. GW822-FHT02A01]|uniref:nucleotidyltransferase family protein n=1 Tax=Rhodoferax sp. GW822-FHT02A01 TaxID=3141537 RepID=UPI00315D1963